MDMDKKKLLILGSNNLTCEIVEVAKSMGLYTIVLDWNPIERAPAKRISDEHVELSLSDIDSVVEYIKNNQIDGVMTGFTDSYLEYYAEICNKSNLPCYATKELFHIFSNKHIYKKYLVKYGVPCIEEYDIKDLTNIRFPVLVKPSDNSGGRGISVCNNQEELILGHEKAMSFSPSKNVLIEQYVKGREVTVFYFFDEGKIVLTGIGNRYIGVFQDGVIGLPCGYAFPADISANYSSVVFPNVCDMLNSLGVKNGMMFMQCLIGDDNVCRVYDIGFRLTGSLEYILMEKTIGINPLKEMIRFSVKEKNEQLAKRLLTVNDFSKWEKYGLNISVLAKPGKIVEEKGIDVLRTKSNIIKAVSNHSVGDEIKRTEKGTLSQIVLRVFALFENVDEVYEIVDFIKKNYDIIGENNQSMLLPIFNVSDFYIGGKR